jgi:hypothetical protein
MSGRAPYGRKVVIMLYKGTVAHYDGMGDAGVG